MGCKETGHSHAWPTDGVLVIQRCEIRCNFCTGDKALKEWKYAWFLRRHVRAVHCKGGKGEKYDLAVATQWKADQDKCGKKAANYPKSKKVRVKLEDDDGDEDFEGEEEDDTEVATEGTISKGKSTSTPWVQQPSYEDVPNQFPGMPASGFQHVNPRDIHFDQALVFGDQDVDTLIDHKKIDSILNDEHILAFLAAHARRVQNTNKTGAAPEMKVEADEDDDFDYTTKADRLLASELAVQQSADFYGLDENGDSLEQDSFSNGSDIARDDRFYMSDHSALPDSDSLWDSDVPLAQKLSLANNHNVAKPVLAKDVEHAMGSLELVAETLTMDGVGAAEMGFAFNHYARVLDLRDDAETSQTQPVAIAGEHMEID